MTQVPRGRQRSHADTEVVPCYEARAEHARDAQQHFTDTKSAAISRAHQIFRLQILFQRLLDDFARDVADDLFLHLSVLEDQ